MADHAELARRAGVSKVVSCRDGDLVRLAPGDPGIIDEVPAGRVYKDGSLLVDAEQRTVADRRRLGFAGIVSVALALTERGELAANPEVDLVGIPETTADGSAMITIAYDAVVSTFEELPRPRRRDPEAVAEAVRRAVRAAVATHWNKKPMCRVQVLEL
jgi:ribonuclease J